MHTYVLIVLWAGSITALYVCLVQRKKLRIKNEEIAGLKEQSLSSEAIHLLKRILTISFEKGTLAVTGEKLVNVFVEYYNIAYCTLLLYSPREEMKIIATNISISDNVLSFGQIIKAESYFNQVFSDIQNNNEAAMIQCSDNYLSYPTAPDRKIKYFYFIPLMMDEQVLGALVLEDTKRRTLEKYDGDLFLIAVENTSLVLQKLIYADRLLAYANMDGLTQVYNRRYMETYLDEQIEKHSKNKGIFAVLMFDIDHFKKFNDSYGHLIGDEVLKIVSGFVKNSIRAEIDNIFRYGGEEFVIFLADIDDVNAYKKAELIREGISNQEIPTGTKNEYTQVTASFGVSMFPRDGISISGLIEAADRALYYSKENGRNQVTVFSDKILKVS